MAVAVITSIGEKTTDLCKWALERNGFEVYLYQSNSDLWSKLKAIYDEFDEDFLRVDADTIVNSNITPERLKDLQPDYVWWFQFMTFDWYKQDITHGGVQFIKKEAIPYLREGIKQFKGIDRPETQVSRIKEFYNPRRFESHPMVAGLTNYKHDINLVRGIKAQRNQSHLYDFELAQRIDEL